MCLWVFLEWNNVYTKFRENRSDLSNVELVMHTYHKMLISYSLILGVLY
jgi:hypothetical protein